MEMFQVDLIIVLYFVPFSSLLFHSWEVGDSVKDMGSEM